MEGAKLLRQYSHTREERLDQLSPVIVEFFHLQQDLLHVSYEPVMLHYQVRIKYSILVKFTFSMYYRRIMQLTYQTDGCNFAVR